MISRIRPVLICLLVCLQIATKAQSFPELERSLAFHADVLVNASKAKHREQANTHFFNEFHETLLIEGSEHYPYDSLEWVSKLIPPDSSFRIFSWQLMINPDEHRYFGIIQILGESNDPKLIVLNDNRPFVNAAEYADYDGESWYGALYYGLHAFTSTDSAKKYLLLGYNANDGVTNYKIADILTFGDGGAKFDSPVFISVDEEGREDAKQRILLKYSDYSNVRLRYDDQLEMLIYDHIIPYAAPGNPESTILVADGSFEAYRLTEGRWIHIEKVFHHFEEEAPRPNPILDERKSRDIFGRDRD